MRGSLDLSSAELIHQIKLKQETMTRDAMSILTETGRRERLVWVNEGLNEALKVIEHVLESE